MGIVEAEKSFGCRLVCLASYNPFFETNDLIAIGWVKSTPLVEARYEIGSLRQGKPMETRVLIKLQLDWLYNFL